MPDLLRRDFLVELTARAAAEGERERVIDGRIVPFGEVTTVRDSVGGPTYRETIARGALDAINPEDVLFDFVTDPPRSHNSHDGSRLVGRALGIESREDGAYGSFLVARTAAGDELLGLADAKVVRALSIQFAPVAERRRDDGVIERTAIDVRRVTAVPRGAYTGAEITAVRAAAEDTMAPNQRPPAASGTDEDPEGEGDVQATPAPAGESRPNRTRVTTQVDVERGGPDYVALLERQELERRALLEQRTIDELARQAGPSIRITRPERVYHRESEHFFLRDQYRASRGDWEAAQRVQKHAGLLAETAVALERAAAWDWTTGEINRGQVAPTPLLGRAGDVLSSELGGAYPTDFAPGLLTPRILKGRPMGSFYDRFPIADARVRQFPKVTTSTTVAVQSAEGAALSSTDFATTAVNVTPLMYGAFTDVSRQSIDGADPLVQSMLLQDLNEAYAQASETVIKTAVEAGSTASGVAITAATPYAGTLANVINYFAVRFRGATGAFIPSALFQVLAGQGDTTGRPFLPMIGAVNSDGVTLADDTELALGVLTARSKLSYASTVNVNVFGRPNDFVTFESSIASFSFDQVVGPQAVRVGIWSYLVVGARLGSLKVTAA